MFEPKYYQKETVSARKQRLVKLTVLVALCGFLLGIFVFLVFEKVSQPAQRPIVKPIPRPTPTIFISPTPTIFQSHLTS